jgi:hypothetical protein
MDSDANRGFQVEIGDFVRHRERFEPTGEHPIRAFEKANPPVAVNHRGETRNGFCQVE